ncbi:MAG: hypothetical protein KC535_04915 [Nanoarchaeota archaeon]|nr:hypothetical protein [Nanoarchaeota archaeon]
MAPVYGDIPFVIAGDLLGGEMIFDSHAFRIRYDDSLLFPIEYVSKGEVPPIYTADEIHLNHALLMRYAKERIGFGLYADAYISFFCGGTQPELRKTLGFAYAANPDWVFTELENFERWATPIRFFTNLSRSDLEEKLGRFISNLGDDNVLRFK